MRNRCARWLIPVLVTMLLLAGVAWIGRGVIEVGIAANNLRLTVTSTSETLRRDKFPDLKQLASNVDRAALHLQESVDSTSWHMVEKFPLIGEMAQDITQVAFTTRQSTSILVQLATSFGEAGPPARDLLALLEEEQELQDLEESVATIITSLYELSSHSLLRPVIRPVRDATTQLESAHAQIQYVTNHSGTLSKLLGGEGAQNLLVIGTVPRNKHQGSLLPFSYVQFTLRQGVLEMNSRGVVDPSGPISLDHLLEGVVQQEHDFSPNSHPPDMVILLQPAGIRALLQALGAPNQDALEEIDEIQPILERGMPQGAQAQETFLTASGKFGAITEFAFEQVFAEPRFLFVGAATIRDAISEGIIELGLRDPIAQDLLPGSVPLSDLSLIASDSRYE